MDKFNQEKKNTNNLAQESIHNAYKIEGNENVKYDKYLISEEKFKSRVVNFEQNEENQSSILKVQNDILKQNKDQIPFSIIDALESNNIEFQRIGASMIKNVPEHQRNNLEVIVHKKIIEALNSQNIQIQRIAINMIQFVPENTRDELKELVLQRIIEALNSNDVSKQRIMAKKISNAPESAQDSLREIVYIKTIEALNQEDIRVQRFAATMVQYSPKQKQVELVNLVKVKFELAKQQGKFNQIVESSLYLTSDESHTSTFSRETFSKTGSETTLLHGKQFKNNLIIRHIEEPCFSAWKKAYDGYSDWIEAGFNYVPIEPIYSFSYNNTSKLVNVVSGVLDINLEEWYAFSGGSFKKDLDEQKSKIINTLTRLDINHGHPNNANFCLRFYREENGNVDINKAPRIYLIDFDKAVKG